MRLIITNTNYPLLQKNKKFTFVLKLGYILEFSGKIFLKPKFQD